MLAPCPALLADASVPRLPEALAEAHLADELRGQVRRLVRRHLTASVLVALTGWADRQKQI